MKLLRLILPVIVLAGCAESQQTAAVAKREPVRVATDREIERLREEARANFEKLKAGQGGGREAVAQGPSQIVSTPAPAPVATTSRQESDSSDTGTQYWVVRSGAGTDKQRRAAAMRAYELEYAKAFGKSPGQITREERAWIRQKFDL